MAKQSQNPDPAGETQKHTTYPYYTLDRAIRVAEVIRDLGGTNRDVQKSQIAHSLQIDEASSSFPALLGAARLFRLIEGRGTYKLTEVAKHFFFPTHDRERQLALLQMIKGPALYSSLIERFDGSRLPSSEILVNILHREHGIAESWQTRAASMFLSSLREAQVIDGAGFLRFKASVQGAEAATNDPMNGSLGVADRDPQVPSAAQESTATQRASVVPKPDASSVPSGYTSWNYRGIRLEAPESMTKELWQKLSDYVNVLKPGDPS